MTKTRSFKTILTSLLTLAMLLCSFAGWGAISASATDAATYDLWIGGIRLDDDNLMIDSNDNAAISGSATYDPNENTLTLDNFVISGLGYESYLNGVYAVAAIWYGGDAALKLVLNGESTVQAPNKEGNYMSMGLYSNADVEITGEGSLTAIGGNVTATGTGTETSCISQSYGVNITGKMTVLGGTLIGTGGTATSENGTSNNNSYSYGVNVEEDIEVSGSGRIEGAGGATTSEGGASFSESYGVNSNGNIKVSDSGTIKGTGSTATSGGSVKYSYSNSYGVHTGEGDIEVSGSGRIEGTGGQADATGEECGSISSSYGVYTLQSITVSDDGGLTGQSNEATAQASVTSYTFTYSYGYSNGVRAAERITVADRGSLTGTGNTAKADIQGTMSYAYSDAYGVCSDYITVADHGSLTGTGGTAQANGSGFLGADRYSDGVCADSDITVADHGSLTGHSGTGGSGVRAAAAGEGGDIAVSGGTITAFGDAQAFSQAPDISERYATASVRYGDTDDAAAAGGDKEITELSEQYNQKFVCIVVVPAYVVSLKANGGVGEDVTSDPLSYDDSYTLPSCPFTYAGKHFVGWSRSADGEVITEQTITIKDDVMLYAIYAEHSFGDWVKFDDSTHKRSCTCGAYETESHSFGDWVKIDDSTHKRTCTCGAYETESHSFGEWTVTKEATEAEAGSKTKTCGDCDHSVAEEIPMLENEGLSGGAIVGIVIGIVACLGGGAAIYWFVIKKKRT